MAIQSWQQLIEQEQKKPYFQHLKEYVATERRSGKVIYPPEQEVFSAFKLTPLDKVNVVLLGQDPYHGEGQAHGLCFSVKPGIKTPPSLVNIYKELTTDIIGFDTPNHGYLADWAKQGVLMINTVFTVEQGKAHSHANIGWEQFTYSILSALNFQARPIIFMLWGSHAAKTAQVIKAKQHCKLKAPHPSPLSAYRGFLGCKHFSQVNQLLEARGEQPINWQL